MPLITTCSNCGSQFQWDETFWKGAGMPDCPACGFNNQTGRKGKGEGAIELGYRKMARDLVQQYGSLRSVEYLSHYPNFEINFTFDTHTVYSGRRRGEYDINFLSLGYVGEGPRYAQAFLDELGFSMTSEEIASIKPGAIIKLEDDKVVAQYKVTEKVNHPPDQARGHAPISRQVAQPVQKKNQPVEYTSTVSLMILLAAVGAMFGVIYAVIAKNWLIGIISFVYIIWWLSSGYSDSA